MYLIDHNDPTWQKRVRRINGAYTYSVNLVEHQVPKWEEVLTDDDIISTCPKFSEARTSTGRREFNTAIQYLHSYPYSNPIGRAKEIRRNLPFKVKNFYFLSAYREYVHWLNTYRLKTMFCPMSIDVAAVRKHQQPKMLEDRIIYFGNVIQNKVGIFNRLKQECKNVGLAFDYISNEKFNGEAPVTHDEALNIVSTYKYGIGVGRAAQELMALGTKTIIAGHKFGGLITNDYEASQQIGTNMNGRIITYSQNIQKCLKDIDKSILVAYDIAQTDHSKLIYAGRT